MPEKGSGRNDQKVKETEKRWREDSGAENRADLEQSPIEKRHQRIRDTLPPPPPKDDSDSD